MTQNWSLSYFENLITNEGWCEGALGCSTCLLWTGRKLDASNFSGCASATFNCQGQQINRYLGCYEDDDIIPRCFGDCPDYCNFHGICRTISGTKTCVCDPGWTDKACKTPYDGVCPTKGCGDHGYCNEGKCICDDGFSGEKCSKEASKSRSSSEVAAIVLVLILLILIVGGSAGYFYYKKQQKQARNQSYFSPEDLEIQDDEDRTVEIDRL